MQPVNGGTGLPSLVVSCLWVSKAFCLFLVPCLLSLLPGVQLLLGDTFMEWPGRCQDCASFWIEAVSAKSVPSYRSRTCEIPSVRSAVYRQLVQVIQACFPVVAYEVGCMLSPWTTHSSWILWWCLVVLQFNSVVTRVPGISVITTDLGGHPCKTPPTFDVHEIPGTSISSDDCLRVPRIIY